MSEIEKLRGLLRQLRVSINLDGTEYGLSQQEKRSLAAEIDAALSQQAEPAPSKYSDVVSDGGMDPRNAPHPAQDEREAFEVACMEAGLVRPGNYSPDFDLYVSERVQGRYEGFKLGRATRPAQTEQPEQSEELAWEVLRAATDALDRRAAPHAWLSQMWNAGSRVITARRNTQTAPRGETK